MQYQDISNLTADEIILRYETLLTEREKQIRDLSTQVGEANEKYYEELEMYETLLKTKEELETKKLKTEDKVQSEIAGMDIMNKKIDYYIQDNSRLKREIQERQLEMNSGMMNNGLIVMKGDKKTKSGSISDGKKKKKGNKKLLSEGLDYEPVFD
jgi:hypothetical protein